MNSYSYGWIFSRDVKMTPRGEDVPKRMKTKRRVIIIVMLVMFLIIATSVSVGVFAWVSANKVQSAVVQSTYAINRAEPAPISQHRARSMTPVHVPTAMAPWGIALDTLHGYVWVAEPGCEPLPKCPTAFPGVIGQYALSDGSFIQSITEPSGYSSPLFIVVDTAGHLWFTQPNSDAIGEYDPRTATWNQWHTKKGSTPYDLVFDTQGNLWFTEMGSNSIGFLNTHTQTLVENPISTKASNPYGITIDAKGTIWFAENHTGLGQIGSFTPNSSGKVHIVEHQVDALRPPHLITSDMAGNIWYSEGFAGYIGEFNAATGINRSFRVYLGVCTNPKTCTGTHISGIHVDNQGNIWFTDSLSQRIGYLVPSTGQVITITLPANVHPHDGMTIDSSNRVWFTEQNALTLNMFPTSNVK